MKDIFSNIQLYHNIYVVALILFVIFAVLSVILFLKFDIINLVYSITGKARKKAIKKLEQSNSDVVVKESSSNSKETQLLTGNETQLLTGNETVVLNRVSEKPEQQTEVLVKNDLGSLDIELVVLQEILMINAEEIITI